MKKQSWKKGCLILYSSEGKICVAKKDILYVKASSGYVLIYITGLEKAILITGSLLWLEEEINSDNFFRTDKSWLVNLARVTLCMPEGKGQVAIMDNLVHIPVSRRKEVPFLDQLTRYKNK